MRNWIYQGEWRKNPLHLILQFFFQINEMSIICLCMPSNTNRSFYIVVYKLKKNSWNEICGNTIVWETTKTCHIRFWLLQVMWIKCNLLILLNMYEFLWWCTLRDIIHTTYWLVEKLFMMFDFFFEICTYIYTCIFLEAWRSWWWTWSRNINDPVPHACD